MIDGKTVVGIILVAGDSTRYGTGKNKNFEIVYGEHIMLYSLKVFNSSPYVDELVIVYKETEIDSIKEYLKQIDLKKPINLVIGGRTRQESVYNALKVVKQDIVLVHDGARPLIKKEYIKDLLNQMDLFSGATVGVKSKDTIKITNDEGVVIITTKRANTWIIQTPQCFDREVLLKAHMTQTENNPLVTDDCMLLENLGYKVKIVEADYSNIKVTTKEDIELAKGFLKLG